VTDDGGEVRGRTAASEVPTLGERLDRLGRRVRGRMAQDLPWAAALTLVVERAATHADTVAGRFDRVETSPEKPAPPPEDRSPGRRRGAVPGARLERARPRTGARAVPGGDEAGLDDRSPHDHDAHDDAREHGDGRPVPPAVRARLRDIVGPEADRLRVHDGDQADGLARSRRADAVTVGRDVHFRRGRFRPQEPDGFALLAHEATHVAALARPGAAWRRATGAGRADEEDEARAREAAARRATLPAAAPPAGWPAGPVHPAAPAMPALLTAPAASNGSGNGASAHRSGDGTGVAAPPALRPMAAAQDRATDTAAATPAAVDLEALRRSLIDDLRHQLRTEFERGG
jgi:hypothetical protein